MATALGKHNGAYSLLDMIGLLWASSTHTEAGMQQQDYRMVQ